MLKSFLHIILYNIPLILYQIWITHPLRPSITVNWTNPRNSFNHIMIMIFGVLTYIWYRVEYCYLFLKKCIQFRLSCFIKTEEKMLELSIVCHNFLYLSQPRPPLNWITETWNMPKELGLFYVAFLTVLLYIQLDPFIIV